MAPEQARGEPLDERADVFGLGGVLCEILTGQPPFEHPRSAALWLLDQDRDLEQVHDRLEKCSADAELVRLARECLADNPGSRLTSARVVAERMAEYRTTVQERLRRAEVDRASAEARVEAARARTAAERRARQLLAGLTLAALLLVVLIVGAGWWLRHHRSTTDSQVRDLLAQAEQLISRADERPDGEEALVHWRQAGNLVDQASQVLENGLGSEPLREQLRPLRQRIRCQVGQLARDHAFLEKLTEIRIQKEDEYDQADTDGRYLAVFRDHGLDVETADVIHLARELRRRFHTLLPEVTAALDDWCQERRRLGMAEARWQPLVRLASSLDDDPWRNALRTMLTDEASKARHRENLLALDLAAHLINHGGIAPQLFAIAMDSACRCTRLRELASHADSSQLSPASTQLLASMLRREGDYLQAVRLLRAAQQRHPCDVWLNHDLAQALYQQPIPQVDEAIRFYTAARAIRPEIGHALAHAVKAKGQLEEAANIFRELIRLRPKNANHYNCLADVYADMKQPHKAVATYRLALAFNPSLGIAWLNLGKSLLGIGDKVEAEMAFRQATLHLPRSSEGFERFVGVLHGLKQFAEAEQAYRSAIELNPGNAQALFNLALLLSRPDAPSPRIDEAAALFEKSIEARPNNPEALTNLGFLRWRQGHHAEAVELLRRASQQNPDNVTGQWQLGVMLSLLGRPVQALEPLKKAKVLAPKNAGVLADLGQTLATLNRSEESFQAFREALALDANNSSAAHNFGNLLCKLGRHSEAVVWYRSALAINPRHPESYCNLGHALREMGEFRAALAHLQRGHSLGQREREWKYPSTRWVRDCERLVAVDVILADLLTGKRQFDSMEQRLVAMRICWSRRMHAARVRLIREALAIDTTLPEKRPGIDLASAAVSALAVFDGSAADSEGVSLDDRAVLRDLALTWLIREVEREKSALQAYDPKGRDIAHRRLAGWLRDPTFAAIRDSWTMLGLSAQQSLLCVKLWDDVKRLLGMKAVTEGF
jgi:tetratricopeptide (TPR) repeat protein